MSNNSFNQISLLSDQAIQEQIGKFIQYHRLQQNKSQNDTAQDAGISRSTLSLLERGEKVNIATLLQVLRVLDLLHILEIFQINEEISPIEYAKLQKKKRKRARSKEESDQEELEW